MKWQRLKRKKEQNGIVDGIDLQVPTNQFNTKGQILKGKDEEHLMFCRSGFKIVKGVIVCFVDLI